MQRSVMIGAVIGGMVAAAGIGWALGSQIRSPAEVAAAAGPPPASNITVAVVRQVLSADVITRGDITYDEPVQLSLSGSFADQPENLVVTDAVEPDTQLGEGALAVEVVGRPVFLLQGEIPVFRDLRPGATGVDVLQLEEALSRMGHFAGVPNQTFDTETSAAITTWYQDAGYVPSGASAEDALALEAARGRVRAAQRAVSGEAENGRATLLQARSEVEGAVADLELARLDAEQAGRDARRAVDTAMLERAEAVRRMERAENGQHPDTGDRPTSAELSALRRELRDAEATLADAQFLVDRTTKEQASLVAQARDRVEIARASLADLDRGSGDDSSARDELVDALEEVAALEAVMATWLPAGEVIFLSRLPVRVDQVSVARGSQVEGPFVTVSGSQLTVRTSVQERDAHLLSEGMRVEIENPSAETSIAGTITQVADRAGTHNVAGDRVYVEVEPADLPSELIGMNVRVTIPVRSTAGEVLAVPAAALSATAAGKTIVQVEDDDGSLRTVEVEPGLATGGLVEVTPLDGQLEEGDLVVVGREDGRQLEVDEIGTDPDEADRDGGSPSSPDDVDGEDEPDGEGGDESPTQDEREGGEPGEDDDGTES